jgi:hypothetical protein
LRSAYSLVTAIPAVSLNGVGARSVKSCAAAQSCPATYARDSVANGVVSWAMSLSHTFMYSG